jgi:rod shape determining protein RodA
MFNKQLMGLIAGLVICVIMSFVDYHFICKLCIPLYIFNIVLMLICKYVEPSLCPFFYGKSVDDARRWIHIGGASGGTDLMPSEITKIVLILCLAKLFVNLEGKINKLSSILLVLIISAIPIYLVFDQPDLSTTIVIGMTFLIMFFVAGLTYKIIIPILAVVIPSLYAFIWYVQQDYADMFLKSWQRDRILSLLHPEDYPDLMYQQNNAATAIKSGNIFGKMIIGDDSARLTRYVPVVESDFIFSGVGEELGFIGSAGVIILFVIFLFLSLKIAINAKDKLGMYIATGIAVMITIQAFVNIGVVLSVIPNTGIPLPFMSSGLSSLLTNFATIGILVNVGLQCKNATPIDKDVIVWSKYHKPVN